MSSPLSNFPSESESFQAYHQKMKALCDSIGDNAAASAATCAAAASRAAASAKICQDAAKICKDEAVSATAAVNRINRIAPGSKDATLAAFDEIVAVECAVRAISNAERAAKSAAIALECAERTAKSASEVKSDPFDETDRKRAAYFNMYVFGTCEVPTVTKPHPHCKNCVVRVPGFDVSFLTPEDQSFAKEYKLRLKIAESVARITEGSKVFPITA